MKNKVKRVIMAILASTMLLGVSITSNAQSADTTEADHVHDYFPNRSYYNSYTLGTHSYLEKRVHHEDGSVEEVYGTCYRVIYFYNLVYECRCGASYTDGGGQEIRHMQCGAPNE